MFKKRERKINNTKIYWFILPRGLHPVLCQLANSFTKNAHQDQFYTIHNTCNQQATIAHSNKQPTAPYNSCSTNTREMSWPLLHGTVPQCSFRWGWWWSSFSLSHIPFLIYLNISMRVGGRFFSCSLLWSIFPSMVVPSYFLYFHTKL